MFEFILREYKDTICNQSFVTAMKKLSALVRGLFFASLVLNFAGAILSFFGITWGLWLFCGGVVIIIVTVIYHEKSVAKQRKPILQEYLEKRIAPLTILLKNEHRSQGNDAAHYNLYNHESLEWLIIRCNRLVKPNESKSTAVFMKVAFPILTLIIGVMMRDVSLKISVAVFLVVVTFAVVVYVITEALDMLLGADKRIARELMLDLEYIQTLLSKSIITQAQHQPPSRF